MSVEEVAEFAEDYSSQLRSMKRPAKEEINALTMVASDYVESPLFAHAVVQVLERAVNESQNDLKLIPLYVMDSILKNVKPANVYADIVSKNLTRVMAFSFMAVDNGTKPKFIKLLKTWDENEIFSPAKIHEIRDTMMLMLQNGGIFPEHLNAGGQGPQVGGQAHMAQGPMDVEASYSAHHAYNNQPGMNMHRQYIGGLPMDIEGHFAARKSPSIGTEEAHRRDHVRGSNSPIIRDSGGPRVMDVKELISRDVSDVVRNLYDARPHMCKHDGRRFKEKAELERHLDDVFAKNKSKKERTGGQERLWFIHVDEWVKAHEVNSLKGDMSKTTGPDSMEVEAEAEVEKTVVVSPEWSSSLMCEACHEQLKKSWCSDSDSWVFRGVINLASDNAARPELFHQSCHRASVL